MSMLTLTTPFYHPSPDAAFGAIPQADCHIALAARALGLELEQAARTYLAEGPSLILTAGTPHVLRQELAPHFTETTRFLLEDALGLVERYCRATEMEAVRFRLERISHDSCRHFHMDHVVLRLLCTYVGPGVQWRLAGAAENIAKNTEESAIVYQAEAGTVALLKGGCYPGWQPEGAVLHRSPPLSALATPTTRLLLTLDAPQACGMSDEQRRVVRV